jgi:hypothetical protein
MDRTDPKRILVEYDDMLRHSCHFKWQRIQSLRSGLLDAWLETAHSTADLHGHRTGSARWGYGL